jgi:hypothetical protein
MAKAIKNAQGAEVTFAAMGKWMRATWGVAGKKGANYVRWQRTLNEEGRTIRLFKDVFNQGGDWIRRDWKVGGPPR